MGGEHARFNTGKAKSFAIHEDFKANHIISFLLRYLHPLPSAPAPYAAKYLPAPSAGRTLPPKPPQPATARSHCTPASTWGHLRSMGAFQVRSPTTAHHQRHSNCCGVVGAGDERYTAHTGRTYSCRERADHPREQLPGTMKLQQEHVHDTEDILSDAVKSQRRE